MAHNHNNNLEYVMELPFMTSALKGGGGSGKSDGVRQGRLHENADKGV